MMKWMVVLLPPCGAGLRVRFRKRSDAKSVRVVSKANKLFVRVRALLRDGRVTKTWVGVHQFRRNTLYPHPGKPRSFAFAKPAQCELPAFRPAPQGGRKSTEFIGVKKSARGADFFKRLFSVSSELRPGVCCPQRRPRR